MLVISAGSAPFRELFSARDQRYELIFGLDVKAVGTKSAAVRNCLLSRQPFAFSVTFSVKFAASRA